MIDQSASFIPPFKKIKIGNNNYVIVNIEKYKSKNVNKYLIAMGGLKVFDRQYIIPFNSYPSSSFNHRVKQLKALNMGFIAQLYKKLRKDLDLYIYSHKSLLIYGKKIEKYIEPMKLFRGIYTKRLLLWPYEGIVFPMQQKQNIINYFS